MRNSTAASPSQDYAETPGTESHTITPEPPPKWNESDRPKDSTESSLTQRDPAKPYRDSFIVEGEKRRVEA